uniref:Si:dkey-73n10.1 n=1 Tax=Lates calcarifer TaxID=8187 RepID=A0A4W6DJ84_LATCA
MSSQSMQTLIDPVFRSKMPLFDGTIAAAGLSKPQNMSGFLGKQALQYSGAYFTYDPRGKDGAGFTSPWSNSKTSLLDSRSPVSHLPGMEGQSRVIYRQDSNSSEESHSHSSSLCHAPVKQGFTLYTKSPGISSPVAVRKQKAGGENSSPPSENSVYLAIPKPVYGHNPCCNELGCVIGQRYSVEHGSPRIPNAVYEHDWMQVDAHYTERPSIQRKAQDTLLQQRGLQFEPSAEPLKRMTVEAYSPSATRTLPPMIDPNYSSYPCTPTRTLFGSLSEQSQRLRTSPRGYPGLYPSHPTYEHVTSEVYQERSPMSKYGQLTQHPVFYYPQANEEVQNSTRCKNIGSKQREDVPVILKHTISNPREHYIVPQSLHGEIPLPFPSTETLPNHSFMQGFDYPCYAVPRFHLNASQIRTPLKRQHASPGFHTNRIDVSPSSEHIDHHLASAPNLLKDKPNTSRQVDQSQPPSPFLRVDQTSPARCISQPGVSPPSIQMNRFFSPLSSLHIDRHILPPPGLNRLMDYSSCETQVTCPKQPKGLPVSPAAWLPRSPSHNSDRIHTAVPNANVRKIIYSPAVATGSKHNGPTSSSGTTALKGCLKRSISHSSSPVKIKEEGRDLYEVELTKKRQKVEMENVKVGNKTDSPPMPVIDNVFSLAPYQAYLQASGVLFPGRVPQRTVQLSEHREVKTKPDIKEKRPDQDEQQPVACPAPKEICPVTPTEKPAEILEPKNIKVEKVDLTETGYTIESPVSQKDQKDCSKVTVKKEPEESVSCDSGHMLVIKKYEPDEPESKTSLGDEHEKSDESKPIELTAQVNSFSKGDTCSLQEQVATLQSITPPQPSESKLNFKNIPPQCLKLSTYKIILPDMKHSSSAPPTEKPPAQLITDSIPKLKLQMPVRKHFFELHHSLCKLISKSVSASSEQELRTWLSQFELTEPASPSTKVQKVSCLLGVKAREAWLNEEMKSALQRVLERLREYTTQERCPFPHVMRTGAVFLPMLVMKELLFPMVQGGFIDQVLQEHKVELRPTTLSEEKILIQLHKRACSSRLRRLMSLKHLPDIYADVVNLLYYTCVCKHLESTSPDVQKRVQD